MQTFKILRFYCVNDYFSEQMDVETAFLNSKVKSEVYINQRKGYVKDPSNVFKLEKALYGLRESPLAKYETFDNYVNKLNFERSNYDSCLYVKRN